MAAEPEHGWHGYSAKVQAMAKRLKEGRTFQRQLLLTSAGLSEPVSDAATEQLPPMPGLSARVAGKVVLILHTSLRRGRRLCHVATLKECQDGPGDASHIVSKDPVEEVVAEDLQQIAPVFVFCGVKRGRAWFQHKDVPTITFASASKFQQGVLAARDAMSWQLPEQPERAQHGVVSWRAVLEIQPSSARAHVEQNLHRCVPREAIQSSTVFVWDFPWPLELDARPWRCATCKSSKGAAGAHYFAVSPRDILDAAPEAVHFYQERIGHIYVTTRWLLHFLTVLYSEFNFRAVRRRLLDIYFASALSCLRTGSSGPDARIRSMLRSFPDAKALAILALHAFGGLIQKRVDGLVALQALMNGQGIRLDGHFKMAKVIRRFSTTKGNGKGRGKSHHPFACIMGFTGTDGSLLQPPLPLRAEACPDMQPMLQTLLSNILQQRLAAGLSLQDAAPTFVATDSYHKHRLLLEKLRCKVGDQLRIDGRAGAAARVVDQQDHPVKALTHICGEPYHDVINARKLVSPRFRLLQRSPGPFDTLECTAYRKGHTYQPARGDDASAVREGNTPFAGSRVKLTDRIRSHRQASRTTVGSEAISLLPRSSSRKARVGRSLSGPAAAAGGGSSLQAVRGGRPRGLCLPQLPWKARFLARMLPDAILVQSRAQSHKTTLRAKNSGSYFGTSSRAGLCVDKQAEIALSKIDASAPGGRPHALATLRVGLIPRRGCILWVKQTFLLVAF